MNNANRKSQKQAKTIKWAVPGRLFVVFVLRFFLRMAIIIWLTSDWVFGPKACKPI